MFAPLYCATTSRRQEVPQPVAKQSASFLELEAGMAAPSDEASALFAAKSPMQRLIITPVKLLFDAIWHLLAYIAGVFLVGGILVNVVISLATTGSTGVTDPTSWAIVQPLFAHPEYAL